MLDFVAQIASGHLLLVFHISHPFLSPLVKRVEKFWTKTTHHWWSSLTFTPHLTNSQQGRMTKRWSAWGRWLCLISEANRHIARPFCWMHQCVALKSPLRGCKAFLPSKYLQLKCFTDKSEWGIQWANNALHALFRKIAVTLAPHWPTTTGAVLCFLYFLVLLYTAGMRCTAWHTLHSLQ